MWAISASFNIFGYQTREIDLTPALGLGLIVTVMLLVGATTMGY